MTTRTEHWEPPDPPKLLVSARRIAAELDISPWKANEVAWCLDRRFYGPSATHYRVTYASLVALRSLLDLGLDLRAARDVMIVYKQRGLLPPPGLSPEQAQHLTGRSRPW